jgi:hypothetical protein
MALVGIPVFVPCPCTGSRSSEMKSASIVHLMNRYYTGHQGVSAPRQRAPWCSRRFGIFAAKYHDVYHCMNTRSGQTQVWAVAGRVGRKEPLLLVSCRANVNVNAVCHTFSPRSVAKEQKTAPKAAVANKSTSVSTELFPITNSSLTWGLLLIYILTDYNVLRMQFR